MQYAVESAALHISYGSTTVLWDLNFKIPQGVVVGVLGPNGAGKSTLFRAALGLVRPLSGTIDLLGSPARRVQTRVAYVPQRESIDWDFPITAKEVVLMGRYGRMGLFGRPRKADREAAAHALQLVGMEGFADRQISKLSGGQQQRLFIARALVQNADLLLLDEPFSGVDAATEKAIMNILKQQKKEGKTVLIIHHDLVTVEEYFDWVILLNTRLIACGSVPAVFHQETLRQTFGKTGSLFNEAVGLSAKKTSGIL